MLFKNDLFLLDGLRLRVLHIDARIDKAWVISIDDSLAWPITYRHSDIQHLEKLEQSTVSTHTYSQARLRKCDEGWARLQPIIEQCGIQLFDPTFRKLTLGQHAETAQCSERTLYKDLRRYWQRGQTKFALLPDYNKSGRSNPSTTDDGIDTPVTAGRGRKPKWGYDIYQITALDEQRFKEVIEQEYLPDSRVSMVDAYNAVVNRHYYFEDGNADLYIRPPGSRPSQRQFFRFLKKHYDIEVRLRKREGDQDFEREHRKKLGTILMDCLGVGHFYEIDATIVDLYLVSSESIQKIIGKPTLYLIIDRKSRLIVGFYFGLENASWNCALQAILSISEDKRELCNRYGVKYHPDDWPAHQVFPMEFLADRGDMISNAGTNITEGLDVTVTNLPSQRPDWKPLVECGFRLIHNSIRPDVPAYDPPSNAMRRRGKRYEKDACLTMTEFGNVILNAIIMHNRREILDYPLSTQEIFDDVRPSPIELWNHGIVTRSGLLTRYEEQSVRFALLRKKKAVVTEHGVEFLGCYYSFPDAIAHKWFETARKGRFSVTVSYDNRLVDSIYIHSLDGKREPYIATLTERSNQYRGMSFDEVAYFEALRAVIRHGSEEQRLQNSINLKNAISPVAQGAKKKLKEQARGISRSARRADVKDARQQERSTERKHLAKIDGGKSSPPPLLETPSRNSPDSHPAKPADLYAERLAAAREKMRI